MAAGRALAYHGGVTLGALSLRWLRLPRVGVGWARHGARLADAVAAGLVALAALAGAGPLLRAADLATGAGDWHAHAFRIRDLAHHGLAPWTHDWAGGLPLWSAYQFVPHAVTWAGTLVPGAEIPRAMAVAQALLGLWLPLASFLFLRVAGLRTLPALVGALLVVAFDTRRQATLNFSELWGLALAPPLLWAAYAGAGRRAGYLTAIGVGAAVYVHPLAAVVGGLALVAAAIVRAPFPAGGNEQRRPAAVAGSLPSPSVPPEGDEPAAAAPAGLARVRRLAVTVRHRAATAVVPLGGAVARARRLLPAITWLTALALQVALALGAAAFFLWPLWDSARPTYEHPYFVSPQFERMLARLAVDSFLPGWPLWLTGAGLAALGVAVWGSGGRRAGARFLLVLAVGVTALALGAIAGWGPRAYRAAQVPRLLALLPLLAAAAVALGLDELLAHRRSSRRGAGRWVAVLAAAAWARPGAVLAGTALAVVALLVADGGGRAPARAALPVSSPTASFTRWLLEQPPRPAGARVVAGPELAAEASYFAYGRAWYTGSYSGREWSILAGALAIFMDGFGAPETRAAFLTAMAVDLAVVPAGARPAIVHPDTGEPAEWEVVALLGDHDVLRLPWAVPYAFTVPAGAEVGLAVPDLPFTTVAEAYVRDVLTRRYAALALGPAAMPARVRAPSGTTLDVELPELPPGRVLLVSETWDEGWRAEAGGVRLPVRRAGPNLLAVDLTDAPRGVRGDVYLRLTHGLPRAWWLGGLTVLLTLPLAALTARWGPRWRAR
jgi:hypothetical protein